MLEQAASQGWKGRAAQCLAAGLQTLGPRQLSAAISRGVQFSGMSYAEAVDDTCSIAWVVATTCTQQLVKAPSGNVYRSVLPGYESLVGCFAFVYVLVNLL